MGRFRLGRRFPRVLGLVTLGAGLSACSAKQWERNLRFGWPTGVTKQAERMRVLWTWSSVAALVVGVIVWSLIFWVCVRYRKRDDDLPRQTKENLLIEAIYTIVPFFIIGALFYYTVVTENYVDKRTANPDVTVDVTAFKWNWQFAYVGTKYTAAGANAEENVSTIGTSTEIPILVIPQGKRVRVVERSNDVIHSFWVPEFLFKRDVIPQPKPNEFEFTATSIGHYVGRCAELCGTYHSQMNFEVRVVSPQTYAAYKTQLARLGPVDPDRQAKALSAVGEAPQATTTHPFDTDRNKRSASR
ncbi:MAG: cytochrome c oxidase subunit II [Actinomycetota bacterium]|nr:cytochrome c oxidase subunit II [Actinomycetota bacterium]